MLSHAVYFDMLSRRAPGSAAWRATAAGLLAVRLAERRAGDRRPGSRHTGRRHSDGRRAATWREVYRVWRAVRRIDRGAPVRRALLAVVRGRQPIAVALGAYAARLYDDGERALAADVYATVRRHARPRTDALLEAEACERGGECLRALGQWDEAASAFRAGRALALARGDAVGALRMRIAEAGAADGAAVRDAAVERFAVAGH